MLPFLLPTQLLVLPNPLPGCPHRFHPWEQCPLDLLLDQGRDFLLLLVPLGGILAHLLLVHPDVLDLVALPLRVQVLGQADLDLVDRPLLVRALVAGVVALEEVEVAVVSVVEVEAGVDEGE